MTEWPLFAEVLEGRLLGLNEREIINLQYSCKNPSPHLLTISNWLSFLKSYPSSNELVGLTAVIINLTFKLLDFLIKSDFVFCPNHCCRFFSHQVLRRPRPLLLSIFSCKMFSNKRYLALRTQCPKYSNFRFFMVTQLIHINVSNFIRQHFKDLKFS